MKRLALTLRLRASEMEPPQGQRNKEQLRGFQGNQDYPGELPHAPPAGQETRPRPKTRATTGNLALFPHSLVPTLQRGNASPDALCPVLLFKSRGHDRPCQQFPRRESIEGKEIGTAASGIWPLRS